MSKEQEEATDVYQRSLELLQSLYGDGKPRLFVSIAMEIALSAAWLPKLLREVTFRERSKAELPPPGDINDWLSMYTHPSKLKEHILSAFFGHERGTPMPDTAWRQFVHLPDDSHKAVVSAVLEDDPHAFDGFIHMLKGVEFPPDKDTISKAIVQEFDNPARSGDPQEEMSLDNEFAKLFPFYVRVWFPCYAIYKTYPPMLMRKARKGCVDSLEKLVRLDKSCIADKKLAQRWLEIVNGNDRRLRRRMLTAISEHPKGKLDNKRVHYMLAGLISQIALALKCPVTAPEIGDLFDRIERVRTGKLQNQAIGVAETLARAVHRNRIWASLPRK